MDGLCKMQRRPGTSYWTSNQNICVQHCLLHYGISIKIKLYLDRFSTSHQISEVEIVVLYIENLISNWYYNDIVPQGSHREKKGLDSDIVQNSLGPPPLYFWTLARYFQSLISEISKKFWKSTIYPKSASKILELVRTPPPYGQCLNLSPFFSQWLP